MTQIAIIQAAPQSTPPATTHPKGNPDNFFPHLEKAVTEATQSDSEAIPENFTQALNPSSTDAPTLKVDDHTLDTSHLTGIEPEPAGYHIEEGFIDALTMVNPANTDNEKQVTTEKELPSIFQQGKQKNLVLQNSGQEIAVQPTKHGLTLQAPGLEIAAQPAKQGVPLQIPGQEIPAQPTNHGLTLQPPGLEIAAQPAKQGVPLQIPGQEIPAQPTNHGLTLQPPGLEIAGQHAKLELTAQPEGRQISIEVTGKEFHLLPREQNSATTFVQSILSFPGSGKTSAFFSPLSAVKTSDTPLKVDITTAIPQSKNNLLLPSPQIQTVVQQLQQIINNANESGTVSIQGTMSNFSLQYHGEAGTEPGSLLSGQIVDQSKVAEKPGSQIPTLRQDMLAQYFDAKVNARESGDSGSNTQSNDQQNNTNNQQIQAPPQANASLSPEQSGSFQNVSTLLQDLQTGQTQNSMKSVTLPSGTVVNEDNVMQQIVERFQINNRANDTKISLKLHPEELGELKIDLTLKEGSIKANVIAHSQHVMEIIEKNMIKLRTVLEDQGFTVEEIVVTSESDSVPDFDLFEQHLSQQKDFSPLIAETGNHNDFDIALDDAVEQSIESTTGVNIQA